MDLTHSGRSTVDLPAAGLSQEAIALAGHCFNAARSGEISVFEQALPQGLPANLTNDHGDTLLMLAAYHGHLQLVTLLVGHGADPNRLNDRGQSPLAGVVFKNEAEIVKVLLEAGADPEAGEPSALEATKVQQPLSWSGDLRTDNEQVFKQQEYESMFTEQIAKLKAGQLRP
ncbi:hypothetical protein A1O1_01075 [Capronia coronata CBS 617.96]|uniref:Uncharacterized protein n=1 Tax=Capronia coronata CBS 617.96 TaxID=1182541 RepID=W9Z1Y6_9EURO|nr:uncharacterized protein A1O1_01075 [Capronia coronata CBS 617.96]EXJ95950.1 hypothetical protein A1O1_01075 [Capronia coronata CBS 617.96]